EAFGSDLKHNSIYRGVCQGVYVDSGARCRSLVGIAIDRSSIGFEEFRTQSSELKLKATFEDSDQEQYKVAVSAKILQDAWREGGTRGIEAVLPERGKIHLRIGLARAFEGVPKCYMMLNGVL
ncbi:hypothetical protein, partial [Methylocystis parvus]|uniref:hypothetical protein n=1 Tax=Methylocystis parvus TaxID=134 RepID=UPI000590B82A